MEEQHQSAPPNLPNLSTILPSGAGRIAIVEHGRDIHVHRVTEPELDGLTSGYNSVHLAFFTLCLGLLIGFLTTLLTVDLPDRKAAIFVAGIIVTAIMGLYFGAMTLKERVALKKFVNRVKEGEGRRVL
ncbi:MAG: hypothetical protein HY672_04105 [Chloroflexi bacterium]|nr:hypothetical protein [Chloroflexota bacterium]